MEFQARSWHIFLVATMLVLATGAAFLAGAGNAGPEANLPPDSQLMLTYRVEGSIDGVPVQGSFGVEALLVGGGNGGWATWPLDVKGNLSELATLPSSILGAGSYLASSSLGTPWGEKQVMIFIGQRASWSGPQGVVFIYKGALTDLVYRLDLVSPEARATYVLSAVNITGMEGFDLRPPEGVSGLMAARQVEEGFSIDGEGSDASRLLEPPEGASYAISVTLTDRTFMAFREWDIWSMLMGGDFRHAEDWSLSGNGSREFVLSGQMMFFCFFPDPALPGSEGRLTIHHVDR